MSKDIETVKSSTDVDITDPLYAKQKEDVAKMRASLLLCNTDASLTKKAMQNISVLRIYHQMSRIIRYLDLMDKLEDKLYKSIDYMVDTCDITQTSTWIQLMRIQETLQKNMIDSQKLLAPYTNMVSPEMFDELELFTVEDNPTNSLLDSDKRESLRIAATSLLAEINQLESDDITDVTTQD